MCGQQRLLFENFHILLFRATKCTKSEAQRETYSGRLLPSNTSFPRLQLRFDQTRMNRAAAVVLHRFALLNRRACPNSKPSAASEAAWGRSPAWFVGRFTCPLGQVGYSIGTQIRPCLCHFTPAPQSQPADLQVPQA